MQRLSRLFGRNREIEEVKLNCDHLNFTEKDAEILANILFTNPTLIFVKHPLEQIIIHFKHSFDPNVNTDCLEQAHDHRIKVIDKIYYSIERGFYRLYYVNEDELVMYLSKLRKWVQLMKEDLQNSWQHCAVYASIQGVEPELEIQLRKEIREEIQVAMLIKKRQLEDQLYEEEKARKRKERENEKYRYLLGNPLAGEYKDNLSYNEYLNSDIIPPSWELEIGEIDEYEGEYDRVYHY